MPNCAGGQSPPSTACKAQSATARSTGKPVAIAERQTSRFSPIACAPSIEHGNALSFYDAATRVFLRDITLDDPIHAAEPLDGRADRMLVSSGGHLVLIDSTNGTELARSAFLGNHLADRDQLATETVSPTAWRIGVGSDVGVYRYRLELSDRIFASGFEP